MAISIGVVGSLFVVLIASLLWRFCSRRRGRNLNDGNMNPNTPQYDPVPTTSGNDTHIPLNDIFVPLNDNSVSMGFDGATSHYGLGIQNNLKYGSIIILLPPCSNSFIVKIFHSLLSPLVLTAVSRCIVVRPHSIRINQRHHYCVLNKSITILKNISLVPRRFPTGHLSILKMIYLVPR